MSVYKCGICGEYKDADISGCSENPFDELSNICEHCEIENVPDMEKKKEIEKK